MSLRSCISALVVYCVAGAIAHAASFDCSKAQRPAEKAICGDPKLNLTDETMGRVYRDSLGRLSSGSLGLLRADQVQWLAWVQDVCHAGEPHTGVAATVKCLLPLYDGRIKQMRTAVQRRDGMTFLTRTRFLADPESDPPVSGGAEFPGFGTLQASWLVADSNDAKWVAWGRAMEAHAFAMTGDGTTGSKPPKTTVWTRSLAEEQDSTIFTQITSIEHGRIAASVSLESMGHGAAHPSESFHTLTWLLDSGRALRTTDVFAAGSAWKQKVADACWKALNTGEQKAYLYPEVNGPGAKPLQGVINNVGNWTLQPDGLHITYPEYSVAPRVSPVDDTVIPWAQLKPVLAAGFVTP